MTATEISTATNPELSQELADRYVNNPTPAQAKQEIPAPSLGATPDTTVILPAGYEVRDEVISQVEVKELNGHAEEALAKATSLAKMIDVLLVNGVAEIGDQKVEKATFRRMLSGDIEAVLVGIRCATFGDTVEFPEVVCPSCNVTSAITINLRDDVPTRSMPVEDARFTFDLPSGKSALVNLPDGETQQAIANSKERTIAALNTLLLVKCVEEINDFPVVGEAQILDLSMRDRKALVDEINERNPGPRLSEVSKSCPECSQEIPLPLGLTDLFLG